MSNPNKRRILFVCIHNSARSQMAEAFLQQLGGDHFLAESAGIEPGKLNQNVVAVMQEAGIDISRNGTQSVAEVLERNTAYHTVITVCDAASAERCPVFPGKTRRIAWSFADPSQFTGSQPEILEQVRQVRNEIHDTVAAFIAAATQQGYWD